MPLLNNSASDNVLLEALRQNNEVALRLLYQRYWRRCYALAYQKLESKEAAEEITQNIFISLWERRNAIYVDNLPAYLLTAIKYQVLNHIESRLSRARFAQRLPPQYEQSIREDFGINTVEDAVFFDDLKKALDRAIQNLPTKTREAYQLSRFENLSGREIATKMYLSEKAVEYHIAQALRLLRGALKEFLSVGLLIGCIH